MHTIARRIQDLNFIAQRDAQMSVVKDVDGAHRLAKNKPIHIEFYKNGVSLEGFGFFTYQDRSAVVSYIQIINIS